MSEPISLAWYRNHKAVMKLTERALGIVSAECFTHNHGDCELCACRCHDLPRPCVDMSCDHRSPDCRDGKHLACRRDSWCVANDRAAECDCTCHDTEEPA